MCFELKLLWIAKFSHSDACCNVTPVSDQMGSEKAKNCQIVRKQQTMKIVN